MEIVLVGLNHRTAPVEIRERIALSEGEIARMLPLLLEECGLSEALVLSTCNRTEVLAVRKAAAPVNAVALFQTLHRLSHPGDPPSTRADGAAAGLLDCLYEYRDSEAIRHLLRVAAGLDSMVLGEPQILAQTRAAYAIASGAGTTGTWLNRALHTAFRTGKRVRSDTDLAYGAVSVAYVAIALARKVFSDLSRHTALVVGAGDMAEAAAMHLRDEGVGGLLFVNRTNSKANELAAHFDGQSMPFDEILGAVERADIVISSTAAPGYLLTHEDFHRIMDHRQTRPIFLIDIAVPRDIDPEINDHDNAFVYDIDSLQKVADRNLSRRQAAIPDAERLIETDLAGFERWMENLRVEPVVKRLQKRFDQVRRCEVEKSARRFHESEREDLDRMTRAIQKKLLHRPFQRLREIDPETEEGQRIMKLIADLFDLE